MKAWIKTISQLLYSTVAQVLMSYYCNIIKHKWFSLIFSKSTLMQNRLTSSWTYQQANDWSCKCCHSCLCFTIQDMVHPYGDTMKIVTDKLISCHIKPTKTYCSKSSHNLHLFTKHPLKGLPKTENYQGSAFWMKGCLAPTWDAHDETKKWGRCREDPTSKAHVWCIQHPHLQKCQQLFSYCFYFLSYFGLISALSLWQ